MATIIITLTDDDIKQQVNITCHGDVLPLEQIDEQSSVAQIIYGHILYLIEDIRKSINE